MLVKSRILGFDPKYSSRNLESYLRAESRIQVPLTKPGICTVSNFIDLIQFHLVCQMLARISGLNPKGPYLSLEKEKETLTGDLQREYSLREEFHRLLFLQLPHRLTA